MLQGRLLGGRYRVAHQLGRGGMGVVYSAMQEDLQRMVALKVLLDAAHLVGPTDLARFRQEALSAAELRHPNIVQVTDFQAPPGEPPFIVMELLTGESLEALLKREPVLAPARAVFIATQILAALGAAHAAGIIHRDIKPGNVFLTATPALADIVKVLDFGIAKVLRARDDAPRSVAGAITGTPAYMAPEQAYGGDVDARVDVYAVGACLFEMLTGRPPYRGRSAAELLHAIKSREPPPPLRSIAPFVDQPLCDVVDRALCKDRAGRPASALDMLRMLAPERAIAATAAMPQVPIRMANATGAPEQFSGADATMRTPDDHGNATFAPTTRTEDRPGAPPPHTMTLASPRVPAPQMIPMQPVGGVAGPARGLAIAMGLLVAVMVLGACAGVAVFMLRARPAPVPRYAAPSVPMSALAQRVPPTRLLQPNMLPSPGALVGDDTEDFVAFAGVTKISWTGNVPTGTSETVPVVFDGKTLTPAWVGKPIDLTAYPVIVRAFAGKVLVKAGDHTITIYDGATGREVTNVETPRPVMQICAPPSGRTAWVGLTEAQAVLLDVDAGALTASPAPPPGCTLKGPLRPAGIFPPSARTGTKFTDKHYTSVLSDDHVEIAMQAADNGDDLMIGRQLPSGKELWRRQEPRTTATPRVIDLIDGRAFVQDSGWLEDIDAQTGQALWRATLAPNRGPTGITLSPTRVYVATLTNGMFVVDAKNGQVLGHVHLF